MADGSTTDGDTAGEPTGGPVTLDGITIELVAHSQSIEQLPCPMPRDVVTGTLLLDITADTAREIELEWHDWAIGAETLEPSDPPLVTATSNVPPTGAHPALRSTADRPAQTCDGEAWTAEVARVLLTVDGEPVELSGPSTGYCGMCLEACGPC